MPDRKRISTGSPFEAIAGYSRAVVDGDLCFVSGTTGYDYDRMELPDDLIRQTENALQTIADTLAQAGFSIEDVVRARYVVTDRAYVDDVFRTLGKVFGGCRPAATMIIADLIEPAMKIEIDVTAKRSSEAC